MSIQPSFKIAVPIVSIYALCLFLPTIEATATYTFNFFSLPIHFGIPALIFPAIYPLADSVTEVYGKKNSYYLIITSYMLIITFSLINSCLLSMADNHTAYDFILVPSLLVTIIGPIGYLITSYINVRYISKLKLKMRGRHFVIRSFICSGLADTLLSLIVLPVIFYKNSFNYLTSLYVGTVLTKIFITIPFVIIARVLVFLFRQIDGIKSESYNNEFLIYNEA